MDLTLCYWVLETTLRDKEGKMPQSGVGSMQGSNEWTHRGGGRTHNVTQRTDTQFFLTHETN